LAHYPEIGGSNPATGFEKEKNCRNVKNVVSHCNLGTLANTSYLYLFLPLLCASRIVVEHSTHNPTTGIEKVKMAKMFFI